MRLSRLILPSAAIAGAIVLCAPAPSTHAWTFIGGSLNLNFRHFRVWNNFSDASANDNTVGHVNYPGYTGAPMALWKAVIEWSSEPHGTGTGDPTQAILGSGGANFDSAWGGLVNSSGSTDQNCASELAGSNGGVLAFTETPISDGWRIFFYSVWDWHDGPGGIPFTGNSFDLQGIMCHEYGHALGLGHTPVNGATMEASVSSGDISIRSIEADDIGGVQALYAVKSGTKPHISSVQGNTASLTINGTNLPTTNVEVWFTRSGVNSVGSVTPLKLTGQSSNGTTMTVAPPAGAGAGDVLVRNGSSAAGSGLSNAYPWDPTLCPVPSTYCTGKVTSVGLVPDVSFTGSNSLAIGNLAIECRDAVPNKPGIYFYGDNGAAAIPFQGGTLCISPPIQRSPGFVFDIFGYTSQSLPFSVFEVGITRRYQFWFRDPQNPDGTAVGLSNAGQVTFCF
jgi:hypothetical protein